MFTNFTKKYIADPCARAGDNKNITVYDHNNGARCTIDCDWMENYIHVQFESGMTLTIEFVQSTIKVSLEDDVRKRDLSSHACWGGDLHHTLVRVYLRHILSHKMKADELEAIQDLVRHNLTY